MTAQTGQIKFQDEDIVIDDWGVFVKKQMIFVFINAGNDKVKVKVKKWKVIGNMLEVEF